VARHQTEIGLDADEALRRWRDNDEPNARAIVALRDVDVVDPVISLDNGAAFSRFQE
jgi:hypothetical protein